MGRPKGSKNRPKENSMADQATEESEMKQENEVKESQATEMPVQATEESEEVHVAIDDTPDVTQPTAYDCPNCRNHGKTTRLSDDGICPVCGFDKSKLYGAF